MSEGGATSHVVDRYFAVLADPAATVDDLLPLLDPGVEVVEHPNRFSPEGSRRDLEGIRSTFAAGRSLLSSQRFDQVEHLSHGECVVTRAVWSGTLAVEVGSLAAGTVLRADIAHFFMVRGGRIQRQETFDCFY